MEELDFLKQHWKKEDNFPKIDKNEIRTMLHKSSSSIVKWIFIICCLEFVIGIALSFLYPSDSKDIEIVDYISWIYEVLFYLGIIYFIYKFYTLSARIKSTTNTKTLIESITKVRENADKYIQFNLLYINIVIATVFLMLIIEEFYKSEQPWLIFATAIIVGLLFILFAFLFRKIVKIYYRIVYGILLKKLNKNYDELISLEENEDETEKRS